MTIPESNMVPNPVPMLKKDSTLAIISLVSGLLGWTVLPVIGAIAAVVTGHLAKKEIRESNNTLSGDGMALAGLILGYVQIGILVLGILCLLVFGAAVFPAIRQSTGF
ncbi:MAG: DUF4190 domain-containing protein [Anaerolineaceae bacterium]|jgi:hypothetical protein